MSYIRKEGRGRCNPGIETLALHSGFSERQVRISLKNLKQALWINWKRTGGSNLYRISSAMERDMKIAMLSSQNEKAFVRNSKNSVVSNEKKTEFKDS
jgi:DNA-binding transcriptional regulator PaaX